MFWLFSSCQTQGDSLEQRQGTHRSVEWKGNRPPLLWMRFRPEFHISIKKRRQMIKNHFYYPTGDFQGNSPKTAHWSFEWLWKNQRCWNWERRTHLEGRQGFDWVRTHEYGNIAADRSSGNVKFKRQIVVCIMPPMAQRLQQLLLPFTWAHTLPPSDVPGEMLKNLWNGFCPISQLCVGKKQKMRIF